MTKPGLGPAIPRSIDEVDSAWMSSAMGLEVRVAGVAPVGVGATFTSLLYRVALIGDAAPSSVIVKLPLPDPAERAPVVALGLYRREVTWYRELATRAPIRSPGPYFVAITDDGSQFVIVMQDLSPLEPADQIRGLTLAQAESIADALARFHAWSWESPRLADSAMVFPALDSPLGRAVNEQLAALFAAGWAHYRRLADGIAPEVAEFADRFGEYVPALIDQLASPRTLAHGELRSDNLFFDADGVPILVDFQVASQEAGVRDLAYIVSQSLPVEVRRVHEQAILRRYWRGLADAGVRDYPYERAAEQYRCAVAFGLVYPMVAFTRYDLSADRGKQVLMTMLERAVTAIADNRSVELVAGLRR